MTPAEFQAAGLYDPSSANESERLELLEWLASRGITIEEMQQAHARGQLIFVGSQGALRQGPFLTQKQLAERLGVSAEVLEAFRVAFALPPVAPEAPWCNEAEAQMFEAVAPGVGLFGEQGMLRLSRVLGSSVSRIAEAMVTSNQERLRTLLGPGAREIEIAKANLQATETAGAPGRIIQGLLALHVQIAATRVRARRSHFSEETQQGCVGFVDLVGSTTLSRRLSAAELAAVVDRFEEVSHDIAINRGGRVVKFIGDEVMFVTGDADSGCDIALALIEAYSGDPAITPRAGLGYGALLDRGGDYYGPVVNLAARLGELAVPREVLVSMEVAEQITAPGLECESAGRRLLRGFDEPVSLMTVSRA